MNNNHNQCHEPNNQNSCTAQQQVTITKITSNEPQVLSKQYRLDHDGTLIKTTSAHMSNGFAQEVHFKNHEQLSEILCALQKNEAICAGVTHKETVDIVTQKKWQQLGCPDNPIPRTQETFMFAKDPGLMILDYDPDKSTKALSKDELVKKIRMAVPGLKQAKITWWPSSSSFIYNEDQLLTGLKGQRLYILVQNAQDIPRAGEALVDYLWAAGMGHIFISKSGAMLERCTVDASVWQSNRLDFAAGAVCTPPLQQKRGKPEIIGGADEIIDTATAIPPLPEQLKKIADDNRKNAKSEAANQANVLKKVFVNTKAQEITGKSHDHDSTIACAKKIYNHLSNSTLPYDFPVKVVNNGSIDTVAVHNILKSKHKYNEMLTLDPLDPDYDGGRSVGKLFLNGASPILHSFAHGGQTYKLQNRCFEIELIQGKTAKSVKKSLDFIKKQHDIFDMQSELVLVYNGTVYLMDSDSLAHELGSRVQFYKLRNTAEGVEKKLSDPPLKLLKETLSLKDRRGLKQLNAVVDAPCVRPDGTLLLEPGYDPVTKLFLDFPEVQCIPKNPTIQQCEDAFDTLLYPFREFPFCTELDWGVLIAALITSVIRPCLPTSPAFAIDSPVQGSGKTYLAQTISNLATTGTPSVWPHSTNRYNEDEEIRKRLFSILREGSRVIIFDNITSEFNSGSFAAALTSEVYQDRVLGKSESARVPNRSLFLLTGNNLMLSGDMLRRVLTLRIDPAVENVHNRKFELNPIHYMKKNRMLLVRSILTLIRGAKTHTVDNNSGGKLASFEIWDDLVRKTVCWLHAITGKLDDPIKSIDNNHSFDPEKELHLDFFRKWAAIFEKKEVTTKDILAVATKNEHEQFCNTLIDFTGNSHLPTPKGLGKALSFKKDRVVDGYVLKGRQIKKTTHWSVVGF